MQEECGKVIKSISNWADGVYTYLKEAAQEQDIHFPDPKILELITEVKNELQDIYQNVMYEGVIPQYKALRDLVAPVVSYVTRYLYSLLVGLADARVNIINALLEEITNLREQLKTFTELCVEGKLYILTHYLDSHFNTLPRWGSFSSESHFKIRVQHTVSEAVVILEIFCKFKQIQEQLLAHTHALFLFDFSTDFRVIWN